MSTAALAMTHSVVSSPFTASLAGILQRKCDCGSSAGLTGECEECRKDRLLLQPKLVSGGADDRFEQEADQAAEMVTNSRRSNSQPHISQHGVRLQRQTAQPLPVDLQLPPLKLITPDELGNAYTRAAGATFKALLKTSNGKLVLKKLGDAWDNFSASDKAVLVTTGVLTAAAGITGLAQKGQPLPFQLPDIPLKSGWSLQVRYEGPVTNPTFVGLKLSWTPGAKKPQKPHGGAEPAPVLRKASQSAQSAGEMVAPPIVHEVLDSPGQPLDAETASFMGARFSHDFSRVRVHTGAKAAESAHAVNALAYTVGNDVVFGAGQPDPNTQAARPLLAHELAHTIQQRQSSSALQTKLNVESSNSAAEADANRAAATVMSDAAPEQTASAMSPPGLYRKESEPQSCDKEHTEAINNAKETARGWLGKVNGWFDSHLRNIKRKATLGGGHEKIGSQLFAELSMLDRHFKFAEVVSNRGLSHFPDSAEWEGSPKDYEVLGQASYEIRNYFASVKVEGLDFRCEAPCPREKEGIETLGDANPGSLEFRVYTHCFDQQTLDGKVGVVLHEAFHASFNDFNTDSYSFRPDYPGKSAVTNADSYATFASIVATGRSYRVKVTRLPEVRITPSSDSK